jgi:mannose-6-phosphate isomerase-like protein (cupin superfamily)
MHVTRLKDAVPYFPAEHNDMRCLRLQGHEAGPADLAWVGMSQLLPGGHTSLSATNVEKFYVVLEGELTIENGEESVVLQQWDSCRIAPGEKRALRNETNRTVTVLLSMPLQKPEA